MSKLEEYLIANSGRNADFGILVALYTGIRIGELCALTWKDIDLKEGVIYIRNNVQRVRGDGGGKNKTHTVIQTPKTSEKGFDVKSVSEILGHSDIRLTMELYVHSSVQQKKMLMNRFGSYLHQGERNG